MTYYELLHSVEFEEIAPFVAKYHGDESCMAWYKIHFDMLRQMTPRRDEDDIDSVAITYYEPDDDEKDVVPGKLDAYPLEGDYWEVSLAKELNVAPNVTASLAEIAACCLWHTSFYGFTPRQREETFRDLNDKGVSKAAKRIKSIYGDLVPSKNEMLGNKLFHNKIRCMMKPIRKFHLDREWAKLLKNVSFERKRNWRRWARWYIWDEYNRIISKVGGFVEMVRQGEDVVVPPSIDELGRLFRAKRCNITSYETYTNDATKRFEYFRELILEYDAFARARLPKCVVCVSSSAAYPVSTEEMTLTELVATGCDDVKCCVKVDDSLGCELKIDAAFYEI